MKPKDELERHYTPQALADEIASRILDGRGYVWGLVEPSVGGGAFVKAFGSAAWTKIGVDLDPDSEGIYLCDEMIFGDWAVESMKMHHGPGVVICGNPPFSAALEHTMAALRTGAGTIALIMPLAYLGQARWVEVLYGVWPVDEVWPVLGRPWPRSMRETAVYVWRKSSARSKIHRPIKWSS